MKSGTKQTARFFLFTLLAGAGGVLGQSIPAPSPTPSAVTIVKTPGTQPVVKWTDGREAALVASKPTPGKATARAEVTENSCNDVVGIACRVNVWIRTDLYRYQWTKHSDSTKIGKNVKRPEASGSSVLSDAKTYWFKSMHNFFPKAVETIPNDELVCESYAWIPGATESAPERFIVPIWTSEEMERNEETDMDENRSSAGAIDVNFIKNERGHLEMTQVRYHTGKDFSSTLYGSNAVMTLKDPTGHFCQILLRFDTATFEENKETPTWRPYILGEDEALEYSQGGLTNLLNDSTKDLEKELE